MYDYFLKVMIDTVLPVMGLGVWSILATISVKQLIQALKEDNDKKAFGCIWGIAISVVAVLHGGSV